MTSPPGRLPEPWVVAPSLPEEVLTETRPSSAMPKLDATTPKSKRPQQLTAMNHPKIPRQLPPHRNRKPPLLTSPRAKRTACPCREASTPANVVPQLSFHSSQSQL